MGGRRGYATKVKGKGEKEKEEKGKEKEYVVLFFLSIFF